MRSVRRDKMVAEVMGRLADPRFARLLTATTPDGSRPIVVAGRDDGFADVLDEVQASGGAGNLVVPLHEGYIIVTIKTEDPSRALKGHKARSVAPLTDSCTVGVLLARLMEDGNGELDYLVHRSQGDGRARANLIGAAT